jgi:UDP-N-acetylmuramoyl-tripeptide--D-alanyl-D-alanine ligase
VHASWGNYNTAIGLPLSYFRARPNITHFVAEMGMSALGEIRQMTRMAPPTVSIITAIGPSHLQRLGSMQAIQQAKGEILEGVKPDGVVILNADNRWTRELGERHRKTPVRWFGTGPDADARLWTSELVAEGTRIAVEVQGQKVTLTLPWLGTHHGLNVACALLTAQVLGVPVAEAARALERIDPQRSRIRVSHWHGVTVLEDVYNASPASMVAALEVLARQPGRKIAVLGDMLELGSCEQAGHQLVGEKAAQVADWIVGVGPRARWMVEAAQQQGHAQTVACANHDQALRWLQAMLADGDVVLFKASRSMALERLVEQLTVGRTRS